jgi:hypothetical protein
MIVRDSAVGATFGAGALAVVIGVAHFWLGMGVTLSGVATLAIPLVLLPLVGGGLASVWFSHRQRSKAAAAFDGAVMYLGSMGILCLALVTRIATHPRDLQTGLQKGGEACLALPILFLLCAIIGAPAMVATALVVRRLNLPETADSNVA